MHKMFHQQQHVPPGSILFGLLEASCESKYLHLIEITYKRLPGQHEASDMSRAAAQSLGKALRAAAKSGLAQQHLVPQAAISQQFVRYVLVLRMIHTSYLVLASVTPSAPFSHQTK
jgi:hypothetical protein